MYLTKKHLSRRTVLRGLGATLSLPFLDSMIPAQTPLSKTAPKPRLVAIEMVHGAAGCTAIGREKNYWSPARDGAGFEFTPTLKSLETLREYVTIISNTELHNAMSLVPEENGPMADHARSSAVFLTAAHPRRIAGAGIEAGPSIDQIYAAKIGRETPLRSIELCIENDSLAGVCGHGYDCSYSHTISWASPSRPLPMEMAPRAVFNRLFRVSGDASRASILDAITAAAAQFQKRLGASDRTQVSEYLDSVRDVEARIQKIENRNSSSEPRALLEAPPSVPDSFDEHVELMFDLQALAFRADITRVSTFKMGIDRSQRLYPGSGIATPFHELSHHGEAPQRIEEFAKLNQFHVSKVAKFLERLRKTSDGDGNLLDHSVVLYGSPMGDSDVHAHKFLPLFLAGKGSGALKGNRHLRCPEDTPMANVLLTLMQRLGVEIERIGDSTRSVDI